MSTHAENTQTKAVNGNPYPTQRRNGWGAQLAQQATHKDTKKLLQKQGGNEKSSNPQQATPRAMFGLIHLFGEQHFARTAGGGGAS